MPAEAIAEEPLSERRRFKTFRVRLDYASQHELLRAAEKRCVKPELLMRKINETVLKEGLVDAVLDDDEEKPRA